MPSWKEKTRLTHEAALAIPELAMVFSDCRGADEEFLVNLRIQFPYVDNEYLTFLQISDGMQLDMYHLFGSGRSQFTSIPDGVKRWAAILEGRGIPIGEDPSGDCFVLCKDGSVRLIDHQMDRIEEG